MSRYRYHKVDPEGLKEEKSHYLNCHQTGVKDMEYLWFLGAI